MNVKNIGLLKEYILYDSIYMKSRTDEIILWWLKKKKAVAYEGEIELHKEELSEMI